MSQLYGVEEAVAFCTNSEPLCRLYAIIGVGRLVDRNANNEFDAQSFVVSAMESSPARIFLDMEELDHLAIVALNCINCRA